MEVKFMHHNNNDSEVVVGILNFLLFSALKVVIF